MIVRKVIATLLASAPIVVAHAGGATCREPRVIEFSVPAAATTASPICGQNCGTIPLDINDEGTVVGYFTDASVVPHGFIRTRDGHLTTFDAPGAGLGPNLDEGTVPYSINDFGVIAGQFQDSQFIYHGFIRYPDGAFTTFEVEGAAALAGAGTQALSINNWGGTAGYYTDANFATHGFVRSRNGTSASFDPTGSVYTQACNESCLNDAGATVGFFLDTNSVFHGFVRSPGGVLTQIDGPNAGTAAFTGTFAASINDAGVITGYTVDDNGVGYGFIRYPDGTTSPAIEIPGAFMGPNGGIALYAINAAGTTTGVWEDANLALHGFTRTRDGHLTRFDAAGANGSVGFDGTRPTTINAFGEVTGWWLDTNGVNHGFVFGVP
jgi:probable HAF family extracellular repeat protein